MIFCYQYGCLRRRNRFNSVVLVFVHLHTHYIMPGIEKLHLEDALEDSPQMRSLLSVFEEDTSQLRRYTATLHKCCQRVLDAENELTLATRNLSDHLKSYEKANFPLENDSESVLTTTMKQFANSLDEISSWHHILATQLNDGMMFPLNRFLQADLEEMNTMYELFQVASNDMEKILSKFCKFPKKKEQERERNETNEEVYTARKKFHQIALHYYANLNALQYKRKAALIEPLLGYLHAQRSHFSLGNEALNIPDMETFLSNISASVQGVHNELGCETQKTVELIDLIEKQSQHLYHAEPAPDMPYIPPNKSLSQKSGYLFLKTKVAGVMSKWDKVYFFTQGGNLMNVSKGELGGSLVTELDNNVNVHPLEQEDRRYVFQVSNGKKNVVLQALNERERDEWIATIQNIIQDGGYTKEKSKLPPKSSSRSQFFHSSSENSSSTESTSSKGTTQSLPTSAKSTPIDCILPNTPIVFDMISPSNSSKLSKGVKEGPPMRINPFDQSSTALAAEALRGESTFHEVYSVRFLGSVEVQFDRGEHLVHETIRHIMAARAIHNVFRMTESHIVITNESMRLIDPSNQTTRAEFALQDISFWAAHKENNRLFGFITRNQDRDSSHKFNCHVFEANSSGEEICNALQSAAKIAYQTLMERKTSEKTKESEMELLLKNIQMQEDIDEQPHVVYSNDGQYLVLDEEIRKAEMYKKANAASTPVRDGSGDGDERRVEGAESEA